MKLFVLLLMIITFAGCNSISKTDVVSEPIVDSEEECVNMIVSDTINLTNNPKEHNRLNDVSDNRDRI